MISRVLERTNAFLIWYYTPFFEASKLQKKEEAIKKANNIITSIPKDSSDYEKVEAIFEFLVDNVKFEKIADGKNYYDYDFLYDALCVGVSNCDGFSNAFALLANLCGLNGFEKKYYPSDGGDGHTWNCVCIDDVWYNIDAQVAASLLTDEFHYEKVSELKDYQKAVFYFSNFCTSDDKKNVTALYSELVPLCTNDINNADIEILSEFKEIDAIPTIASVFPNINKPYTTLVTDFKIEYEDFQRLRNMIEINFSYYPKLLSDGRYVYALKPND